MIIGGLPSTNTFHHQLKGPVDDMADLLGISQSSWRLFAPNVSKQKSSLEARLTYTDGSFQLWHSPKWKSMGAIKRFLTFRQAEYFDNIQWKECVDGWKPLAIYLAKTHPKKGLQVMTVEIYRMVTDIPAPGRTKEVQRRLPLHIQRI